MGQPNQGSRVEIAHGRGVQERESTLSPTAKFVHNVMTTYVMDPLREAGLVEEANAIISEDLDAENPRVIEFALRCRELEATILEQARANNAEEKVRSVISNYFTKLLGNIRSGGQ